MNERRKDFRTIMKLAKERKIPASAGLNKTTINNVTYSHRNLDCLPPDFSLESAKVFKVKGGYAFQSEHAWPSNFFPSPIEVEGITFPTVEHAYQFAKASRNKERQTATLITRTKSPKDAKKRGHGVDTDSAWDRDKIDIMRHLIDEKFHQHPAHAQKLMSTGQNNLIEATLHPFWGARAVPSSKSIKNGTWTSTNMLGKILTEARDELRRELGLPEQPMEVSNMPQEQPAPAALPPTTEAVGGSMPDNQKGKQTPVSGNNKSSQSDGQNLNILTQTGQTQSQTQNQSQNQSHHTSSSRKNKNRQSPIPSTGDSPSNPAKQTKKQRGISPPRNFAALGSLFACPPVNKDPVSVSATMV